MNKNLLKKFASVLMALVLSCSVWMLPASAMTDEEFNQKNEALQNKIDQQQDKISSKEKTSQQLMDSIQTMQKQLDLYNGKIRDLNLQIAEKEKTISEYQKEINDLQAGIDSAVQKQGELESHIKDTYDVLGERLRSAYMTGETSSIEILLEANDFQDLLTRLELLRRISKHDTDMVSDLQKSIDDYDALKDKLANDKASVEEKQNTVKADRDVIAQSRNKEQGLLNTAQSKQNHIKNEQDEINERLEKDKDLQEKFEQQQRALREQYDNEKAAGMESGSGSLNVGGNSQFTQSSKGMIFPLQYPSAQINQPYTWNGHSGHRGVDIRTAGGGGNTYGKEIRAVADGVVFTAEYHSSWGNNVYINHGNGVYTRYAHCSAMLVSSGQHVKQGQVIARVGNSGNVYPRPNASNPHAGAHLHFEVWINGKRVNPASWIPAGPDR